MYSVFLAIMFIVMLTVPLTAQSAATGIAKDVARGASTARLSVEELCAKLTIDKVTAIMGKNFERRMDSEKTFKECKYGDSKDKQRVRYFSIGSSIMQEASWRKMVETGGKGKVTERDGVLVSHSKGNRFGPLDEIFFKDRQGHALYLRVNSKISEDQAVALAKAAMD